jgi:hypothetical protein
VSVEASIYDRLTTDVGMLVDDRVFPVRLPNDVLLPAITYQRVSEQRIRSHPHGTSLIGALFQFTCWDHSPEGARDVARAVLSSYEAALEFAVVENYGELFAAGQKIFQAIVDVRLWNGLEEEVAS